ncbi:alpha/beta fold hydrolase [Silicimonas sp. MF1-12-2]|uniref:alpha/beta fold hydrolase n=1 Tax=Silicimonas sp. MF1-12-2 TaxID=3384793 RepID=UPI0039B4EB5E
MRYTFSDCVLDTEEQTLTRSGVAVPVEPQVFDLLHVLAANAGKLVNRDEIVDKVWDGRIVSESAISARIAAARKAVGDDGKAQRIIQTVSRRGFRLIAANIEENLNTSGEFAVSKSTSFPKLRYAKAKDGTTLAYTVTGSGPPLVYVDFFPSDTLGAWEEPSERPLIDALNARFTLVRYDQRGCGMSERDVERLDLDTVTEDLCVVADAAGVERFAIHAHSGACLTAIKFAARYPHRIRRMVLVGGYAEGRLRRGAHTGTENEIFRTMVTEGWDKPRSAFIAAMMAAYMPEGPSDMVRSCAAFMQRNTTTHNELLDRDMINNASVLDCLPRITAPTLVINARHDPVHPLGQGQKIAAGLPNAELLVYDTANHVPIPGHRLWDRYVDDIMSFLSAD